MRGDRQQTVELGQRRSELVDPPRRDGDLDDAGEGAGELSELAVLPVAAVGVDDIRHGRDEALAIVSDDGEHERCHEPQRSERGRAGVRRDEGTARSPFRWFPGTKPYDEALRRLSGSRSAACHRDKGCDRLSTNPFAHASRVTSRSAASPTGDLPPRPFC